MTNNTGERSSIIQWGCLVGLLGAIFLLILGGIWLFQQNGRAGDSPRSTPIVLTATITPSPTPSPILPTRTPVPNETSPGRQVTVIGTGNIGLSMRSEASTTAERVDVAAEGETLMIIEGPVEADGYVWWLIRDVADEERQGWAVDDYLQLVP